MRADNVTRDARFLAFLVYFNVERDYFECHEVMEELWLEEGRHPLLQGLLQAAVGLHHWRGDNRAGAVKLMTLSLRKLEAYPRIALGLDLEALRTALRESLEALRQEPETALFRPFPLDVADARLAEAAAAWAAEREESAHD